jgi:hypothetical protein
MTTDDVITRYNFISKIQFGNGENSMPKELKVKIMKMRIEFGKINNAFDSDVQEFSRGIITDRFNELQNKPNRTQKEEKELGQLINNYNQEINEYVKRRCLDEVEINEYTFSEDEYAIIIDTNSENDVTINNINLKAPDFLEEFYKIFMK